MDTLTSINRSPAVGASGGIGNLAAKPSTGGSTFGKSLEEALATVSKMQNQSQTLTREFQAENPAVSIEETMIAMQQSSLSFQAVVQVRNKLVAAYSEMMNMQV